MGACLKSLPNFNKSYDSLQSVVLGIIYHQNHTNYQNIKSKKWLQRDNFGRKQTKGTKSQKLAIKKIRSAKIRRGYEILQGLRNCEISRVFCFYL